MNDEDDHKEIFWVRSSKSYERTGDRLLAVLADARSSGLSVVELLGIIEYCKQRLLFPEVDVDDEDEE